jgi:hypothetical protein
MSTALVAFLLFVAAFIARAVTAGLELEDYVLWMLAGLACMNLAPVVVLVQGRRQPANA